MKRYTLKCTKVENNKPAEGADYMEVNGSLYELRISGLPEIVSKDNEVLIATHSELCRRLNLDIHAREIIKALNPSILELTVQME